MDAVRAIIADDDPLARRMLKEGLQRAGMVVIAEAHDGRQAVELVLHYKPDVVLMDMVMPGLDGLAATRKIIKESPGQVIVILTSGDDDDIGLAGIVHAEVAKCQLMGLLENDRTRLHRTLLPFSRQ